jgi:hypothetical protein
MVGVSFAFDTYIISFYKSSVNKKAMLLLQKGNILQLKKNIWIFLKKPLTNGDRRGIIYAVIQRQQVPVKAKAFLPRREIELQRCDAIFLIGGLCVPEERFFYSLNSIGR